MDGWLELVHAASDVAESRITLGRRRSTENVMHVIRSLGPRVVTKATSKAER